MGFGAILKGLRGFLGCILRHQNSPALRKSFLVVSGHPGTASWRWSRNSPGKRSRVHFSFVRVCRAKQSLAFRAGMWRPDPPALSAIVNQGGLSSVRPNRVAPLGQAHGPLSGARSLRQCRLPTQLILRHGPRSLAHVLDRAIVRGHGQKLVAQ